MTLWTKTDTSANDKPKFLNATDKGNTHGVSVAEALVTPVTHTGWVKVTTGSGGRANRKQYETIVAMGTITSDNAGDNSVFPDPVITINGQPAAQTIRIASGVNGGSPITLSVTSSVIGGGTVTYQWQVSSDGSTGWTDVVDGAEISGATTNTLVLSSETVGTLYYRLQLSTPSIAGGTLTATSANAQSIGAQATASTTWSTGFVTVTDAAHRLTTGDSVVLSGYTPIEYNGTHVVTVIDADTYTFPLVTDPGATTVVGTTSILISEANASLTWAIDTATVVTATPNVFITGDSATVAGVTPAGYNGTYSITVVDASTFTYPLAVDPTGPSTVHGTSEVTIAGAPTASAWTSNKVTTTVTGHGYVGTPSLTFGAFTPSTYNGAKTVTVTDVNTLTYDVATSLDAVTVEGYVYA